MQKGVKPKKSLVSGFMIWRVIDLALNVNANFPKLTRWVKNRGLLDSPCSTLTCTGIQFSDGLSPPAKINFGSREL